jgi:hypothetical protein
MQNNTNRVFINDANANIRFSLIADLALKSLYLVQ